MRADVMQDDAGMQPACRAADCIYTCRRLKRRAPGSCERQCSIPVLLRIIRLRSLRSELRADRWCAQAMTQRSIATVML